MATKPTSYPRWATVGAAITVPSSGAQDVGHVPDTALYAELLNWFWNLVYQWIIYFDAEVTPRNEIRARHDIQGALDYVSGVTIYASPNKVSGIAARSTSGRICTVGNSARIYTSDDLGASWSSRTAANSYAGDFTDVVYTGNFFIAIGASGEIQTSPTGSTWTHVTGIGSDSVDVIAVDTSGNAVAAGVNGKVYTAVSPYSTWTVHTNAVNGGVFNPSSIATDNAGNWVLTGNVGSADANKTVYYSTNLGSTWSVQALLSQGVLVTNDIAVECCSVPGIGGFTALVQNSVTLNWRVIYSAFGSSTWSVVVDLLSTVNCVLACGDYGVSIVARTPGINSSWVSKDGGLTWTQTTRMGFGNQDRIRMLRFCPNGSPTYTSAGVRLFAAAGANQTADARGVIQLGRAYCYA